MSAEVRLELDARRDQELGRRQSWGRLFKSGKHLHFSMGERMTVKQSGVGGVSTLGKSESQRVSVGLG